MVYVDDTIVTKDDLEGIESLKKCSVKEFDIILGIEVAHS